MNIYDYGARLYDPAIGRWFVVDMLANHELQIDKSPYAYGWNNPIKYVDPNGLCPNGCSESEQSGEPYRDGAVVQNKYGASQWSNGEWKKISSGPMTGNSSNGIRINGFFGGGSNGFGNQQSGGVTSSDLGNYAAAIGYVSGAMANNVGNVIADRAKYPYVDVPGRMPTRLKSPTTIIRTPGGRYVPNIEVPNGVLKGVGTTTKVIGAGAGVFGLGVTSYQYMNGQISGTEASVDTLMGVVGFMGPIGAGASILYFGGKFAYEYYSGDTLFDKPSQ